MLPLRDLMFIIQNYPISPSHFLQMIFFIYCYDLFVHIFPQSFIGKVSLIVSESLETCVLPVLTYCPSILPFLDLEVLKSLLLG